MLLISLSRGSNFSSDFLFFSLKNLLKKKRKKHNLTRYEWGKDYIIELISDTNNAYITGYKTGINTGDLLILKDNFQNIYCYQIEEIDYYLDPPDMWTALVKLDMQNMV